MYPAHSVCRFPSAHGVCRIHKIETPGQPCRAFLSRRSSFRGNRRCLRSGPAAGHNRLPGRPSCGQGLPLLLGRLLLRLLGHLLLGHLLLRCLLLGHRTFSSLATRVDSLSSLRLGPNLDRHITPETTQANFRSFAWQGLQNPCALNRTVSANLFKLSLQPTARFHARRALSCSAPINLSRNRR
jgi:hypothetical protein